MLFSGPTSKCVYEASLEKMYDYGEDIVGRDGGNVKSTILLPAGPSVMSISERFLCRGRLKTNIFTDIVSNKRYTVYCAVYYYYIITIIMFPNFRGWNTWPRQNVASRCYLHRGVGIAGRVQKPFEIKIYDHCHCRPKAQSRNWHRMGGTHKMRVIRLQSNFCYSTIQLVGTESNVTGTTVLLLYVYIYNILYMGVYNV